ncbi:MAG: GDP-mannose 4,6-dehydratase [Candidatus Omnitrophica bacterium]|jgi:GDP-4-dehydro-6-deoxy-D-mannose reductase|nr:GDP-mannose 4,6-dehydratase [Candidatus Omnitrophota bacterium]
MKVLITGITGFAGSHLAEYLLSKININIYGTTFLDLEIKNINHIKENINLYETDIKDYKNIESIIAEVMPDRIFHLAGRTSVGDSFSSPQETLVTNITGQLNIFEAVRKLKLNPCIHIACSSDEYGFVYENELPIKETNPFRPLSPYAVSKVTQDLLAWQYFKNYGLNIIITRAFNHTGVRSSEAFVCSSFAKQIAMIEKQKQPPVIYTGNLDSIRDFSDVKDVARAYWLALEKCRPGEAYNICSGKGYKIREILDILVSYATTKVEIKQDPKRLRPSDTSVIVGDSTKFRKVTGWQPEIPLERTLEDLLDYWRQNV